MRKKSYINEWLHDFLLMPLCPYIMTGKKIQIVSSIITKLKKTYISFQFGNISKHHSFYLSCSQQNIIFRE